MTISEDDWEGTTQLHDILDHFVNKLARVPLEDEAWTEIETEAEEDTEKLQ